MPKNIGVKGEVLVSVHQNLPLSLEGFFWAQKNCAEARRKFKNSTLVAWVLEGPVIDPQLPDPLVPLIIMNTLCINFVWVMEIKSLP